MNGRMETCVCSNDKASHYYDAEKKEWASCLCANCACKKYEDQNDAPLAKKKK
jgi:hypothetical protein